MGRGAGRGGQEAWSGLGNGEGKQILASTAATALSSMTTKVGTTKPPSTAGTSRPTTIAASDILSSKPATAGSFSEDYVQARRSASLAIARKMKLAPGAPGMSPGMSPGAPPTGYTRDRSGWLPAAGIRGNMVNCHPYPRDQKRPVQKHPEPFPDPEWYQELEEAKSRPIGPTDIIPQVQWRDAKEYLKDCRPGTRFPICTHLAL